MIHEKWILLAYYNLTNYWISEQRIEDYLYNLKYIRKTDPKYCKTTLEQQSHEMELLHNYNTILLAPHKTLIRSQKERFGQRHRICCEQPFRLDQQFADKYHQDIEAIKKNENYLLELMKNQTSIVELENKVLKKTEHNINRQLNLINGFINKTNFNLVKMESTIKIMMATSYFNSASIATYLLLQNLKEMQEMLFNTLTNLYKEHGCTFSGPC